MMVIREYNFSNQCCMKIVSFNKQHVSYAANTNVNSKKVIQNFYSNGTFKN
jgi:hypothetical protein